MPFYFFPAGGTHACGCHASPGPLACSHGSCPYFFFAALVFGVDCVGIDSVDSVVVAFTDSSSGAIG